MPALVALAEHEAVDLVVVGPEAPLAAGLVDMLQQRRIPAFGPTMAAATIETSKADTKAMMMASGIPDGAIAETHRLRRRSQGRRACPIRCAGGDQSIGFSGRERRDRLSHDP